VALPDELCRGPWAHPRRERLVAHAPTARSGRSGPA
jgi:hypothetical protein